MAKRGHLSLKAKLACLIIEHFQIDRKHARLMHIDQLLGLIDYNHIVPHTWTQDDDPANLEPLLRPEHRAVTAKRDIPRIAKAKRISKKEEDFRRRILAKTQPDTPPQQAKKKYQWAKGRKLQSRNTLRRR